MEYDILVSDNVNTRVVAKRDQYIYFYRKHFKHFLQYILR